MHASVSISGTGKSADARCDQERRLNRNSVWSAKTDELSSYIIYRERVRRNWSQAGLCKGICTVSYLSKIESGRAEPSAEILRLLLARLNLETHRDVEREAAGLAERGWELLLTGRRGQLHGLLDERDIERYRAVPAWLDLALLSAQTPLEPALEPCMDVRQLVIQRILQRQEAEAVRSCPTHTPT